MNERLKRLFQDELEEADRTRDQIIEHYTALHSGLIKETSQLTGIPQDELIRVCVQTAQQYKSLAWNDLHVAWHDILAIVRAFYITYDRGEMKEARHE